MITDEVLNQKLTEHAYEQAARDGSWDELLTTAEAFANAMDEAADSINDVTPQNSVVLIQALTAVHDRIEGFGNAVFAKRTETASAN